MPRRPQRRSRCASQFRRGQCELAALSQLLLQLLIYFFRSSSRNRPSETSFNFATSTYRLSRTSALSPSAPRPPLPPSTRMRPTRTSSRPSSLRERVVSSRSSCRRLCSTRELRARLSGIASRRRSSSSRRMVSRLFQLDIEVLHPHLILFALSGRVFLHPGSLLFTETRFATPFMTFFSKHVTTKPFLRDATEASFSFPSTLTLTDPQLHTGSALRRPSLRRQSQHRAREGRYGWYGRLGYDASMAKDRSARQ